MPHIKRKYTLKGSEVFRLPLPISGTGRVRAIGWDNAIDVRNTKGRAGSIITRLGAPRKANFVYPLNSQFREKLTAPASSNSFFDRLGSNIPPASSWHEIVFAVLSYCQPNTATFPTLLESLPVVISLDRNDIDMPISVLINYIRV